jgi:hypothetical protein
VTYSLSMAVHVRSRAARRRAVLAFVASVCLVTIAGGLDAAATLQPPEQFIGFRVGADNRLARWNTIVDYMKLAASASDRVQVRELGSTTDGHPFISVLVGSAETLKNLDRYRQLEQRLYFRNGVPGVRERDEIFRQGKAVVLITAGVHSTEVGPTQATLELVHRLATEDSPATRNILENVLLVLVPSANPDGHVMVADWFQRNLGTPFEVSPLPHLYHRYAGHDLNRDMYMLTQKESQYIARLVWHDWLPTVWLDQHQMNSNGARMFVMPAADPINPNVHPLIYRWNGILGQSQAAALEAAGKEGIIYNSTYTNFWQGPLAWSGWWHNQIGLLTEIASARVASPIDQLRATPGQPGPVGISRGGAPRFDTAPLLPPPDVTPRTEYPRPWMGGRWSLRDIVDYSLISTFALLETVADRRETILRNIFEINRQTVEDRRRGEPTAILIAPDEQHDPREAGHLIERLRLSGVDVYRAEGPIESERRRYVAGTYVIPMAQVFARYAKDLLEPQVYPEVRRGPSGPVEPPYDVTAWSLGMLLGVNTDFTYTPLPAELRMSLLNAEPSIAGRVEGGGARFAFDYEGPDTAVAINRLLKAGARVEFDRLSGVVVSRIDRSRVEAVAREFGLRVTASDRVDEATTARPEATMAVTRAPRVALYAPWTGGNMDEGWTRWVLEDYEFAPAVIDNEVMRRGSLRERFDVLILPDQLPREILDGYVAETVRPEYRGGIGELGMEAIARFVAEGGTLVALGAASDLAIDRLPIPVRNLKRALRREQHYAPGTIVNIQTDPSHPLSQGLAPETFAFYTNSPFFAPIEGFTSYKTTVAARFSALNVVASGWLQGEELMAGRAAVISVDMNPGRVILFGIRPQHRGQTHATFPLLFNALYQAASEGGAAASTNQ